jgi:HEAT repeat protein
VGALGKALGHEAPALRLSAVQALAEIASPGALRALETALEDEDRDIRVTAIRAIGAANHQSALSKVDQLLRNKQLRERDQTEQMAVFETYALLAGETGVAPLDVLLNGRGGFLARKESREIRACAAMGLGRIGSPDALDALRRAATDKDGLVRNAVNRAMRGGGA